MSKITRLRRQEKLSCTNSGIDLFRKHDIVKVVQAILECYEYYLKLGYSSGKVTSAVRLCCKDNKDLEWVFLKRLRSQNSVAHFHY